VSPGEGVSTHRTNFNSFWRQWKDDIIKRDMNWIKSINPHTKSLDTWMRETGYVGGLAAGEKTGLLLLKNVEEGKSWANDAQRTSEL
jgi:hypothetical protein